MRGRFSGFTAILLAALIALLVILPGTAGAATSTQQEMYKVNTLDGVEIVLKRYRPDAASAFRAGKQPVILMPGILCNHNFFDLHTPEGESCGVKLPSDLADWAKGDPYVNADPMRYYSLAYYLWDQGYDVWLVNYRGEGRDPVRSGGAGGYAIDELGIYDMPAIVTKVRSVTGKKPVWIGHSMGSTMAYMYLQGAKFSSASDAGSHVVSDSWLASQRNNGTGSQALKGFVDLDGPVIPGGSIPALLQVLLWPALSTPLYLDLRPLTSNLGGLAADPLMALETMARWLWGTIGYPDLGLLNLLLLINPANMDPGVSRYFFRYGLDGVSTRVVAQFADAIVNGKLREDYRNGLLNSLLVAPPEPRSGDGYYYYSDNLGKIKLPALVIADATRDITNPEDIRSFYDRKTRNSKDRYYVISNTAHVDLVMGLNAPKELFPKIGDWLKSL
ncbi:MAG: alpha/beta fold hydrolase [Actinobacteria bacterium]|nr:alpha/beta fold hydrolase [Actinomycetota bacterium]